MDNYKHRQRIRIKITAMVVVCLFFVSNITFADIKNNTLSPRLLFSDAQSSGEIQAAVICKLIEQRAGAWKDKKIKEIYLDDMLLWKESTEPLFEAFDPILSSDKSEIIIFIPGSNICIRYYDPSSKNQKTLIPLTNWKKTKTHVLNEKINRQIIYTNNILPSGISAVEDVQLLEKREEVTIVPVTKGFAETHLEKLVELYNLIEVANWTPEQLLCDVWKEGQFGQSEDRIFFSKWEHSFAAVDKKGVPVGLLLAYERPAKEIQGVDKNSLYIHGIAIDSKLRNAGIGTMLMKEVSENLSAEGLLSLENEGPEPLISLQTGADNFIAQRFYESLGCKRVGVKRHPTHLDYVYLAPSSVIARKTFGKTRKTIERTDVRRDEVEAGIIEEATGIAKSVCALLIKLQQDEVKGEIEPDAHLPADQKAHEFIVDRISRIYPDHYIISEEDESIISIHTDAPYIWLLDPLCGTREFKKRTKDFGTGIMCFRADTLQPVISVMYGYPYEKGESDQDNKDMVMFYATKEGAFLDGEKVTVNDLENFSGKEAFVAMHRTVREKDGTKILDPLKVYRERLKKRFNFDNVPEEREGFLRILQGFLLKRNMGMAMHMCKPHDGLIRAFILVQAGGMASFVDGTPLFPITPAILKERGRLPPVVLSPANVHELLLQNIHDLEHPRFINECHEKIGLYGAEPSLSSKEFKSFYKLLEENSGVLSTLFRNNKDDILLRIPVEALEMADSKSVNKLLGALQTSPNVFLELYYMSGIDREDVPYALYEKYGLLKQKLPEDFKSSKLNTISLFSVLKGEIESKDDVQRLLSERIGGIDHGETQIIPIGLQNDPTGLIRSIIFGLRLLYIARKCESTGDVNENNDFIKETVVQYKELCDSQNIENFDIEADEILTLATGNFNRRLDILHKMIKLLPIAPIDPEELRRIYEYTAKVLVAA